MSILKQWIIKEPGNTYKVEYLAEQLNIDKSLAHLLVQRGISNVEEAKRFFRPALSDLHDPFLMKNMETAVERIGKAIRNNEKILVYGDYDVDGTTAVALVYSYLKKRYTNLDFYIPDRYAEGYGVSFKGVDYAAEKGASLMITLDCGTKAVPKIKYACSKNIDVIICDHHTPGDEIPEATALLNPKQSDCPYPYKELSGCGIGFKLMQAFSVKNHIPFEELLEYIDLVAVSIASDIVPITGENRVLATYGLKKLNENPLTGFRSIRKVAGIESCSVDVTDVVFKIGPRINAAGRIESGRTAVELLISEDDKLTDKIAGEINQFNIQRKDLDASITQDALEMIGADENLKNRKTTVLFNPGWHKGVVGIVASRVIETYHRPTVILTESNGMATGSARTVADYDLYHAIDACSGLLESYGGHRYAAGLTLKKENLDAFSGQFEKYVGATIKDEQLFPRINIDIPLHLHEISGKFYRTLNQLAPFGPGNMAPVFVTNNVVDNGSARIVGKDGEHLKLTVHEIHDPDIVLNAIAFNHSEHFQSVKSGLPFDICYSIMENNFRGVSSIEIKIKDIKT